MKFHSVVLFVQNIQVSAAFYNQILKCEVEHDFGNNISLKQGISLWQKSKEHIISRNTADQPDTNRFELYFEWDDLRSLQLELKNQGVKFLHEVQEEPWGQQTLRFFDPDGHLIECGEPLEVFVQNLLNRGMNLSQVSAKTGIPVETIEGMIQSGTVTALA